VRPRVTFGQVARTSLSRWPLAQRTSCRADADGRQPDCSPEERPIAARLCVALLASTPRRAPAGPRGERRPPRQDTRVSACPVTCGGKARCGQGDRGADLAANTSRRARRAVGSSPARPAHRQARGDELSVLPEFDASRHCGGDPRGDLENELVDAKAVCHKVLHVLASKVHAAAKRGGSGMLLARQDRRHRPRRARLTSAMSASHCS
jgi:hypothetical protein